MRGNKSDDNIIFCIITRTYTHVLVAPDYDQPAWGTVACHIYEIGIEIYSARDKEKFIMSEGFVTTLPNYDSLCRQVC